MSPPQAGSATPPEHPFRTSLGKLARFALVGLSTTLLYGLIAVALQASADLMALTVHGIAYAVAIPISYLAHSGFTFRYRGPHGRAFRRFLITATAAFIVSTAGVYVVDTVYGLPLLVGTLLTMAIVPLVSFFAMLLWVFLEPSQKAADGRTA